MIVKEKRNKPVYLVSTNLYLSPIDGVTYYAKRWKIEQMIKTSNNDSDSEIIR